MRIISARAVTCTGCDWCAGSTEIHFVDDEGRTYTLHDDGAIGEDVAEGIDEIIHGEEATSLRAALAKYLAGERSPGSRVQA